MTYRAKTPCPGSTPAGGVPARRRESPELAVRASPLGCCRGAPPRGPGDRDSADHLGEPQPAVALTATATRPHTDAFRRLIAVLPGTPVDLSSE